MLSAVSKKGIWLTDVFSKNCGSIYNEAPRSKLRRSSAGDRGMSTRVIRTYLLVTALFNLAASLIWGVDTLFKLHAGLNIFQVMLTNAAFTFGMVVCEIPTGVVADTLGRRVSLLLCIATLFGSTLLYVAIAWPS